MKLSSFSLRRLRWKLTLSYTLVTVGALLLVELVALLGVIAFLKSDTMTQFMAQDLNQVTVPRLQPHLVQAPPDLEGLRETLRESFYLPFVPEEGEDAGGPELFGTGVPDGESLTVLDTEQRLLGSVSGAGELAAGENFDVQRLPGLDALLAAALAGEDDPDLLHASSDGWMVAVAPIKEDDESVVGVAVATSRPPGIAGFILPAVVVSAGAFTLVAGLVGTLFGFLTARGLTKRLRKLTHASEAWSRGDFSVVSKDRSRDELGQLSRDLDRMAGQLENLMQTRGELATLEARNRFARDLHDSVKQQVFATSLQIAAARALIGKDEEAAGDHLAEADGLVRGAQRELNVLIHEMRPAALEGKGLAGALRDYAADWSRGCEIPIRVRVRGEREAPLEVEQALFRVAQESLTNVARHSGANRAEVELVYDAGTVTLRVSDDGRGFDPGSPKGGFGLESMRGRLARLGGRVEVESEPGRGTRVVCVCPLNGSEDGS